MTRRLVGMICGTALALAFAGTALAGQPGAECGAAGAEQIRTTWPASR